MKLFWELFLEFPTTCIGCGRKFMAVTWRGMFRCHRCKKGATG